MESKIGWMYRFCNMAKEIWETIQEIYSNLKNASQSYKIWSKEMDMYYEVDWSCSEDSIKFSKMLEEDYVFDFLQGLSSELDKVRGRLLGQIPFPSLKEAFAEGKSSRSKPKKKVVDKKLHSDSVDVDDDALMQAIALSLQDSVGAQRSGEVGPSVHFADVSPKGKTGNKSTAEVPKRRQMKKSFTSRVKMNKDDVVLHFFQFDEAGKGAITLCDLERVAIAHDFTWTDKDLADMINCFDSDEDGKLSLDDFQKIVERCNMVQSSESS